MTEGFERIWAELERESASSNKGLLRRRLTHDYDDGLYLGVEVGSRSRVFLVQLENDQAELKGLPRWREVRVRTIRDDSDPGEFFLEIELISQDYRGVFTAFSQDLYETLTPLKRSPRVLRTLANHLLKWQSFFREYGPTGLSSEAQRGLFGELWFLKTTILPNMPLSSALRAWRGPERQPHDFHLPGGHLEVKVNGKSDWDRIQVSNEQQLDDSNASSLFLLVLNLDSEQPGGLSLPALVGEIRTVVSTDRVASEIFERKLIEDGYVSVHESEYSAVYTVVEQSLFAVVDGFPRIVRPSKGVSKVRYELSLAACHPFRSMPQPTLMKLVKGV
jgi:hypothetical protein